MRGLIVRGVAHPVHPSFPLLGIKVVVDAGHGSGGFFAEQVRIFLKLLLRLTAIPLPRVHWLKVCYTP